MKLERTLLAVLSTAALLLPAAPAQAAVPVLVVDGRGFGHGVGMAQDGALWMGRGGATTAQILGHFYPGVAIGRGTGLVRVAVLDDADRDVTLSFPGGGEVRSPREGAQAPGFPVRVPAGGAVRIRHDGRYRVVTSGPVRAQSAAGQLLPIPRPPGESTTTTTSTTLLPGPPQPGPTTTTPPPSGAPGGPTTTTTPERTSDAPVWLLPARDATVGLPDRGARYRGVVQVAAGGRGLRVLNELDVEQYLRGMGEVRDPSWPRASLQSQAIAARTYALRAMSAAGEICDSQRCQVYLGQQVEYAAMDRAVRDTAGQVLRYRGGFAAAVYSANGGGVSATPREGFGTPDGVHPYLRAAPYETKTPDPWQVRIALGDLAGRIGYPGDLTGVRVAETGPSGRPVTIAVEGSAGPRSVPAIQVQRAMGLRSTKWETRIELGDAPPPPPEPAERVQALPEQAAQAEETEPVQKSDPPEVSATSARRDDDGSSLPTAPVAVAVLAAAAAAYATWRHRRRQPDESAEP